MFHSFIEQIRLLREDCYQFDLVPVGELDEYQPFSYEVENCTLDYPMDFSILCDGSNGEGNRMCSDMIITPRMLYDISPNTQFGVLYELGEFWSDNDQLISECASNLNSTWWSVAGTDANSVSAVGLAVRSLRSTECQWAAIGMVGVVLIETLRRRRNAVRRKKVEGGKAGDGGVYGAISPI